MQITLNGQPHQVEPGSTLSTLLAELGLDRKPCAAEVNRQVVPRGEHASTTLNEGDTIELMTLVGGG